MFCNASIELCFLLRGQRKFRLAFGIAQTLPERHGDLDDQMRLINALCRFVEMVNS